jgi:hypothetical protein
MAEDPKAEEEQKPKEEAATNAQKKRDALNKAHRAVEEAKKGTPEQQAVASAELLKAQNLPD